MGIIIKGVQAQLARPWQPEVLDLTKPGAGATPEEREALGLAAGIYGRKVINLDAERARRRGRTT